MRLASVLLLGALLLCVAPGCDEFESLKIITNA